MRFVSLTNMPAGSAETFVAEFGIPWPSGHGTSRRFLASIGCLNTSQTMPGYEVVPTLFLLDGRGRVLWNDAQGRFRHRPESEILADLKQAITTALTTPKNSKTP